MSNLNQAIEKYLKEKDYAGFDLKAVLFDMDGVLYNSMPNHATSWVKIMQLHGFIMTEEEAYMHEGRTGDETVKIICQREGKELNEAERKAFYRKKIDIFNSCPPVVPMKGSREILRKVIDCSLFTMLVTGSGQQTLLDSLNRDFPDVFTRERMVTSFDVKQGKPNPEPYLTALRKGCLKPNEAIVIENAPLGIEAATTAGIFTIAVNTGPLSDSILLDAGANYLLPSVETLANNWNEIYNAIKATR